MTFDGTRVTGWGILGCVLLALAYWYMISHTEPSMTRQERYETCMDVALSDAQALDMAGASDDAVDAVFDKYNCGAIKD